MKNKKIFGLVLIFISMISFVFAYAEIGTKDIYTEVNGKYSTVYDRELISYEDKYTFIESEKIKTECENKTKEDGIKEVICTDVSYISTDKIKENDYSKPVYKTEIKDIRTQNKIYDFDTKKCFVCGDYIACLSDLDGGKSVKNRSEKFKCDKNNYPIIRSGETGFIENLENNLRVEEKNKIGADI